MMIQKLKKTIFNKPLALSFLLLFTLSESVFATSLRDAKSAGLIGERADGYLGIVSKPASDDVKDLVKEVNSKRKNKYRDIAENNEVDLSVIEAQAGDKLINKTASGNYIYKNGGWTKK